MYCKNCGKNLIKDQKFCSNCGTNISFSYMSKKMELEQKTISNLKKLNLAISIFDFVFAAILGCFAFYILFLITGLISYEGTGGSGLIILAMPFAFIISIVYLILGVFNIKINKEINLEAIKKISIVEICVGVFFQIYAVPTLIISIIRLILLSKLKN